ncbi:hypothetical protein ACFPRA_14320 [Sporosarcina soli]|uniref:Uncharacterized protein n=1 Tax=Sporosarcina soli TaxID=334736 RepID=A0ABW0TMC3_9BACL
MDMNQRVLMLFKSNKIDSRYFDLDAFNEEATIFTNKVQDVKAKNPLLNYEPIFSINQVRGESDR